MPVEILACNRCMFDPLDHGGKYKVLNAQVDREVNLELVGMTAMF